MKEIIKISVGKTLYLFSISSDVLVVASIHEKVGDWSAYIGAATEFSHKDAALRVWHHGTKIQKEIAEIIFPELKDKYLWRD